MLFGCSRNEPPVVKNRNYEIRLVYIIRKILPGRADGQPIQKYDSAARTIATEFKRCSLVFGFKPCQRHDYHVSSSNVFLSPVGKSVMSLDFSVTYLLPNVPWPPGRLSP